MLDVFNREVGGVHTPAFMLKIGNEDITSNLASRLISLTLTDKRAFEADELSIELDDADGQVSLPARGTVIRIFLGWKGQPLVDKGSFIVSEVGHHGTPDVVSVRAQSADFRSSLNVRREESWHDTSLSEIVNAIASRNKLTASVATTLAEIKIPHIDQSQESDAAFLTRLADRNGASFTIKAGKILFIKAGRGTTASGQHIPLVTITRSEGDRHQFGIADRNVYTGVTAKWLQTKNPKNQQPLHVQRKPKASSANIPSAGKSTSIDTKPKANEVYTLGDPKNVFVLTTIYADKAQAMRAAQVKWEQLQRWAAQFSLNLAVGRPELCPETPVKVIGFKRAIDELSWIINTVTHSLSAGGYMTSIVLEENVMDVEYEITGADS
ncbi:phage late control D family protein [Cronobacter malonaticus]